MYFLMGLMTSSYHLIEYSWPLNYSQWLEKKYATRYMDGKNVKALHLNGFDYETDTKHCQNVLSHGAGWL